MVANSGLVWKTIPFMPPLLPSFHMLGIFGGRLGEETALFFAAILILVLWSILVSFLTFKNRRGSRVGTSFWERKQRYEETVAVYCQQLPRDA